MVLTTFRWRKLMLIISGVLCLAFDWGVAQPTYTRTHLITTLDVITDSTGNSYVTGWTEGTVGETNHGKSDMFLAKYNPDGEQEWIKQFGTPGWDNGRRMTIDPQGNVVLLSNSTGYDPAPGTIWQFVLTKWTPDGELLQLTPVPALYGYDIIIDADGYLYTAAYMYEPEGENGNIAVARLDQDGTILWNRQMSSDEFHDARHLASSSSGTLSVAGNARRVARITDPGQLWGFLARISTDGQLIWSQSFSEPIEDIASNDEGTSYITGGGFFPLSNAEQEPYESNDRGTSAIAFLASFDADGNTRWIKQFGGFHGYWGRGVTVDTEGNVVVVGYGGGNVGGERIGSSDAFIVKYTQDGTQLWANRLGSTEFDRALAVTTDLQGNVYTVGFLDETWDDHIHHNGISNDAGNQAFLVKYSPDGEQLWLRTLSNRTDTPTDSGAGND